MSKASTEKTATEERHDPKAARERLGKARKAEEAGDRWTAIELYEQAFELSPDDEEVCFRLAYHLDLVGEESEALHLYEQACVDGRPPVNALMNLAVVYEDAGEYVKAERCLRQVVETDPNHARARLYLKDVTASRTMYYDEEYRKLRERHSDLIDTPVTDFELSARARNCLKKMNVRTIGDLLRVSETELMAYKNFGDTTLQEIRDVLAERGLRIGQALLQQQSAARREVYEQLKDTAGEAAVGMLNQPVEDLDLSVRARKALALLNISTIGDLVARTEAELLGIKNFGTTSLEEIKQKLAANGMSLRVLNEPSR